MTLRQSAARCRLLLIIIGLSVTAAAANAVQGEPWL